MSLPLKEAISDRVVTPSLQALIYDDVGVDRPSVEAIAQQLRRILDSSIVIKRVDGIHLATQSWEDRTVVLILGGGVCKEWDARLGELGIDKIHEYVSRGGRCIGLCSGAYFLSAESYFKQIGQLPIERKRSLAFFEGKAIGPLLPTEDYRSPSAAQAAKVVFMMKEKMEEGFLYYQGGCYFEIEKDSPQTTIISRCQNLTGEKVVAVSCRVNKGAAFLCGMHPEFVWPGSLKYASDPIIADLAGILSTQEEFRCQVWEEMGRTLGLPMKSSFL
ncbi:MAG: hypothetical protein KGZ39_01620 [Simkania sp.]|nr:hypothetical protein [Simkania sp.]